MLSVCLFVCFPHVFLFVMHICASHSFQCTLIEHQKYLSIISSVKTKTQMSFPEVLRYQVPYQKIEECLKTKRYKIHNKDWQLATLYMESTCLPSFCDGINQPSEMFVSAHLLQLLYLPLEAVTLLYWFTTDNLAVEWVHMSMNNLEKLVLLPDKQQVGSVHMSESCEWIIALIFQIKLKQRTSHLISALYIKHFWNLKTLLIQQRDGFLLFSLRTKQNNVIQPANQTPAFLK